MCITRYSLGHGGLVPYACMSFIMKALATAASGLHWSYIIVMLYGTMFLLRDGYVMVMLWLLHQPGERLCYGVCASQERINVSVVPGLPLWLSWLRICLQCRRTWYDSQVGKIPWRRDRVPTPVFLGFSGGSDGVESSYSVVELGSIPGLGRSPGGGHGNPLQCSCLNHPHGQRSLVGYSPCGRKELDTTEQLSTAAVPASPLVFFQPLGSGLTYPGCSEQCAQCEKQDNWCCEQDQQDNYKLNNYFRLDFCDPYSSWISWHCSIFFYIVS